MARHFNLGSRGFAIWGREDSTGRIIHGKLPRLRLATFEKLKKQ